MSQSFVPSSSVRRCQWCDMELWQNQPASVTELHAHAECVATEEPSVKMGGPR